jgi:hypothetical protein
MMEASLAPAHFSPAYCRVELDGAVAARLPAFTQMFRNLMPQLASQSHFQERNFL